MDSASEKLLKELLNDSALLNKNVSGTSIEYLVQNDYVKGVSVRTLSDVEPLYVITEITQKGKSYFEKKKELEKEKKKLSRREWIIAIISACIGGIIGQIPAIIQVLMLK